jgi:hypothetical protein
MQYFIEHNLIKKTKTHTHTYLVKISYRIFSIYQREINLSKLNNCIIKMTSDRNLILKVHKSLILQVDNFNLRSI